MMTLGQIVLGLIKIFEGLNDLGYCYWSGEAADQLLTTCYMHYMFALLCYPSAC